MPASGEERAKSHKTGLKGDMLWAATRRRLAETASRRWPGMVSETELNTLRSWVLAGPEPTGRAKLQDVD